MHRSTATAFRVCTLVSVICWGFIAFRDDRYDTGDIGISTDLVGSQAAETVRFAFNSQRTASCANLPAYTQPGAVQFSIQTSDIGGNVTYSMEIKFGEDAVYAQVAALANNEFQLISSVPDPCAGKAEDQLAVTFTGERTTCSNIEL